MKTDTIYKIALAITLGLSVLNQHANGQALNNTITDRDGNTYAVKVMPDGRQWMTKNLNIKIEDSYCYQDIPSNCNEYGRLYSYKAAITGCNLLGEGWHVPSGPEWEALTGQYGGVSAVSDEGSKTAYKAMLMGGSAGFNAVLGGNREPDGKLYGRLNAHGFYWSTKENADNTVWYYNFGAGGKKLHRQEDGGKQEGFSVRCVRDVKK